MKIVTDTLTKSFLLLFVPLNPFILSVYLLDLVKKLGSRKFTQQLIRAGLICLAVFLIFAWGRDAIFQTR